MGAPRQQPPSWVASGWVTHGWLFLFALLVFGGFWVSIVPVAEIRWAQYLLGGIAMFGAILSARFALTGTLLATVATVLAWLLGVTIDPFLLTSAGVFSLAERRGARQFPWWLVVPWVLLLVWAASFAAEPTAEPLLRAMFMSGFVLAAAWVIGVRTRQLREAAAAQSRTDERLRLARDVHDVLSHSLGVIGVRAGIIAHVTTEEAELRAALEEISTQARDSMAELKTLLQQQRADTAPDTSDSPASPLSALLAEVADTAQRTGLRVEVRVPPDIDGLPVLARTTLHRVVQEAVTNAIRHAAATALTIEVLLQDDEVRLRVADNGGQAHAEFREGHGLTGMRERVALAGGEVQITHDETGFSVFASFPGAAHPVVARGVDRV